MLSGQNNTISVDGSTSKARTTTTIGFTSTLAITKFYNSKEEKYLRFSFENLSAVQRFTAVLLTLLWIHSFVQFTEQKEQFTFLAWYSCF